MRLDQMIFLWVELIADLVIFPDWSQLQYWFWKKQRRPEIHLFGARFKEQYGDVKGARVSYEVLRNDLAVGLLEAIVKHANFEQRQVSNVFIVHFLISNLHLKIKD